MNYEMQGIDEQEGEIGGGTDIQNQENLKRVCNADLGQFQYALIRQPVPHCYIDPNGVAQEDYRYEYYFQNLTTGEVYPAVDVYSANPNKTLKAIIYKINKEKTADMQTAER
jgi:hypothetical protein